MTGNCCRVAVDNIENCMPEEDFPFFRKMALSDGLSIFAISVGKSRPASHADTILKKHNYQFAALSFH